MLSAPLMPLFDPDEGYYPATAVESVDSGDYWDLRFNGAPRWDKPVAGTAFVFYSLSASKLPHYALAFVPPLAIKGTELPIWMVGPRAPSLTFFASRPVSRVTETELVDLFSQGLEGWIVVDTVWLRDADHTRRFPRACIDVLDQRGTMTLARVHVRESVQCLPTSARHERVSESANK